MAADILEALVRANIALALGVALTLALRRPARASFGAEAAYALWAMPPVAGLASLLPIRVLPSADWSPIDAPTFAVHPGDAPASGPGLAAVLLGLWLLGVVSGAAVLAARQARLARALGRLALEPGSPTAVAERAGVGPAVIGLLTPRIVLPADFRTRYAPDQQALILAHERAHLRAGDTRVNGAIALLRCLCWFNPLAHVGAACARLDQELARDAAVAARFPGARRRFAEAMLEAQLAAGAVAAGCGWTPHTARSLETRIAMLARPLPTRARSTAGAILAAGACALVGCASLESRPAEPAASAAGRKPQPVWANALTQADYDRSYPAAALRKGVSGSAQLACRIGAEGALDCSVAEERPEGEGFGQSALNLAAVMRAAPQMTDGSASAGRTIPIHFYFGTHDPDLPAPIAQVPPEYPAEALAQGVEGSCLMTFDIAEDGGARNVSADCTDPMFADSAAAALSRWRYPSGASRSMMKTRIVFRRADDEPARDAPPR